MREGLDLEMLEPEVEEAMPIVHGRSPLLDPGWVRRIVDAATRRRIAVVAVVSDGGAGWVPDDAEALASRVESGGGACWVGQRPGCRRPFTPLWVGSNEAVVGALVCASGLGRPENPAWRVLLLEALVLADLG